MRHLSVMSSICRSLHCAMIALAAISLNALPCATHEIPSDVRVQAFVKPEGRTLQLLMRVPLTAMREVDVPRRGPGYLDLARADAALRTAANLWLADNIDIYEGATRLAYPRVVDARATLASAMRWLIALIAMGGAMWAVNAVLHKRGVRLK